MIDMMRSTRIILIILSAMFMMSCATPTRKAPQEITVVKEGEWGPVRLQVQLTCDKSEVSLKDIMVFEVKLVNHTIDENTENISLFSPMEFGAADGLNIHIMDKKGKKILEIQNVNHIASISTDDSWPYITLFPRHYLGIIHQDSVENIFRSPGTYFVFAEYLSPVTESDMKKHADPQNFWGRELGLIRSVPLEIKVANQEPASAQLEENFGKEWYRK